MKNYHKLWLRQNSSYFIFHVGINELKSENSSKTIAKEIVNIAVSLKSDAHDVSVFDVKVRANNHQLNLKLIEVNNHQADFCREMNYFPLIDDSKRMKAQHLNNSSIHLNKKGSKILKDVYFKKMSKFLNDIHLAIQDLMKITLMIHFRSIKDINARIFWIIYR